MRKERRIMTKGERKDKSREEIGDPTERKASDRKRRTRTSEEEAGKKQNRGGQKVRRGRKRERKEN